jgi:hypothetical protein
MLKDTKWQSIDPAVLTELAERAVEGEMRLQNPYLRALMRRFGSVALELKAALENEGQREATSTDLTGADHNHQ